MRIVVAMSGGVDSSVAAGLLVRQGHDVIGLSMQLYDQSRRSRRQRSVGARLRHVLHDRRSARRPARRRHARNPALHRQFRARVRRHGHFEFRQRVFVGAHADSVRPLQRRSEVCDAGEPGRGTRRRLRGDGPLRARRSRSSDRHAIVLKRGADPAKDQSYFLFTLTQDQLSHAMFPVGALDKTRGPRLTRASSGLPSPTSRTATRSASSPPVSTRRFSRSTGRRQRAGAIRDVAGQTVGTPRRASIASPSASERASASPRPFLSTSSRIDAREQDGHRRPEGVARADRAHRIRCELDCRDRTGVRHARHRAHPPSASGGGRDDRLRCRTIACA